MNAVQECIGQLKRMGQALRVNLLMTTQECQCESLRVETTVPQVSTCGCGQDTCQIGDSLKVCQPQSYPLIERV